MSSNRTNDLRLAKMARSAATDLRSRACPTAAHSVDQLADAYERLHAALEFYAAEGSWENDRADYGSTTVSVPYTAPIFVDMGARAREALTALQRVEP